MSSSKWSGALARRKRRSDESGITVVTVAICASVMFLCIGYAIDTAVVRSRTSILQATADAAALAAASALPDLATAQARANEAVSRNASGVVATVGLVPNKPGRVSVKLSGRAGSHFASLAGVSGYNIDRYAYAEQSVGIAMGTPYNSIGTGDLTGTIPGDPALKQGYFLAINGPCTAKEDGDRFMSLYDGTRGSLAPQAGPGPYNTDAYNCADDNRSSFRWTMGGDARYTSTPSTQWRRNVESRPGGYSFIVDIPCDGGVTPCAPGTPVSDGVYIDAWDPWFRPWWGEPPCPAANRTTGAAIACVVDKVPMSNPDNNWARASMGTNFTRTNFAIYAQNPDGTFSSTPYRPIESFGGSDTKWVADNPGNTMPCQWDTSKWQVTRRGGAAFEPFCKDWFGLYDSPITVSGKFRLQVAADPQIYPTQTTNDLQWNAARSFSINTFSLRTRRASSSASAWTPCSTESSGTCVPITGEGALSVYVKTPGNADLFLSKLAPAQDYRGRTIQIQLWDPGEGASKIKILEPVDTATDSSGWKSVPFSWSTADPGLADYNDGTLIQDRASGWTGAARTGISVAGSAGLDVSGTYANNTPPWPVGERYSQAKFNGRLLLLDVEVPANYGQDAGGSDLPLNAYQGGWWKIRYESGSSVEDRTTWAVVSRGGPVHLVRP